MIVRRTKSIDFIVRCSMVAAVRGPGPPGSLNSSQSGKKGTPLMVKVEDIQNYGKEQFEQVVANAPSFQSGVQAIVSAYGEYAKKSYEDTKAFAEKLSGVK